MDRKRRSEIIVHLDGLKGEREGRREGRRRRRGNGGMKWEIPLRQKRPLPKTKIRSGK